MPKLEDIDVPDLETYTRSGKFRTASRGKSFEANLAEAREKRARVLEARRAEAVSQENQSSPKVWVRTPARLKAQLEGVWQSLTDKARLGLAGKALLVFTAALGFGLGLSFGLSAVTQSRDQSAMAPIQAATQAPESPARETPVLAVSEEKIALVEEPVVEEPATERTAIQAMPLEPVAVQGVSFEVGTASYASMQGPDDLIAVVPLLPEITKVAYTSGTFAVQEALALEDVQGSLPSAAVQRPGGPLGTRVYIHAPSGISQRTLNAYVAELESSGYVVARVGRESFRISKTHLRYYTETTAGDATKVAEELGIEARDFTSLGSSSERIEVWVQGNPQATAPDEARPDNFMARMFGRLGHER